MIIIIVYNYTIHDIFKFVNRFLKFFKNLTYSFKCGILMYINFKGMIL